MKIGIMTFHNADNYGAVLQCYALQEKLKELYPNDEVCVVDYKCPEIVKNHTPKFSILKPWTIFYYFKFRSKRQKFQDFRTKYLNIGSDDFSKYDLIVYGSDQIWNFDVSGGDFNYFGENFSGKKIAYGVSDGGVLNYTDEVKKLLNQYSQVSCREQSLTDKLINFDIELSIETVCDPVFLLSKEQWLKIAKVPNERNYVLAYKIRENLNFDSEAENIGRRFGKKIIQIVYVKSLRKLFYRGQNFVECLSPEEFIGYFVNADFVLTTSFHGVAFSAIFDKPFFALQIEKASERITNLLSKLNIKDRYGSEYRANECEVQGLEEYRKEGITFLKSII